MTRWLIGLGAVGAAAAVLSAVAVVVSVSDDGGAPGSGPSTAPVAVAPPPRDEPSEPTPIAPDTAGPATRPRLSDLGRPATNPAACAHLRDRATALVKELEPKITAEDRAGLAAAMQDVLARGQRQADGYSAFAGGELLTGNLTAAAWAGLEALVMEWRPDFVANAGVYLYHLERLGDAESFLTCARELDPRSPFVIEAQALLALKRKDCKRAQELIELAVPLLPGDMNVHYSAAIIHHECGNRARAAYHIHAAERLKPDDPDVKRALRAISPASADRPRERDALDRLVEECFAFQDEMLARGELASDYYNLIQRELHQGDWQEDEHALGQLRDNVADARRNIKNYLQGARDTQFGPPDPFMWNQTVFGCADAYSEAVYDYEQIELGMAPMLIFASAYRMDPVVYAGKFGRGRGNDLAYVMLDEDTKFNEAIKPLSDRLSRCTNAANSLEAVAGCYRQFCADGVPLWRAYRDAVHANCQTAEAGYPRAAEDYGGYWVSWTLRAADFSTRAIKIIKATPLIKENARQMAEATANMTQVRIDGVMEITTLMLSQTYAALQDGLENAPREVLGDADGPPAGKFKLCPQDGSDPLNMDEKLEDLLEALKAATKVEYGMALDCEAKVGGVGFSVKAKSRSDVQFAVSKKVGKVGFSGNVNTKGRYGGDVSYSQSVGGGAQGVVGKATVKAWGKARGDGSLDYGAQLEGKIGVGVNFKGVEAACYPFYGKVTVNARAFAAAL